MYCIRCGVELADSEKKCPLCGTRVYHPDLTQKEEKGPYPPYQKSRERLSRKGILFLLSMFFLLPLLLCLVIDLRMNGVMNWSGYVTGGLGLSYLATVLPLWFRRPHPLAVIASVFFAAALYVFYICWSVGGNWFWSFALPVIGYVAVWVLVMVALGRYLRRGYLFIASGGVLALGGFTVMLEFLIRYAFGVRRLFLWSIYPLVVCAVAGVALLVIGLCRPLRKSLQKKFFL